MTFNNFPDPYDPLNGCDDWQGKRPDQVESAMKAFVGSVVMFLVLFILMGIVSLFTSCATQKQEHQQQTHVVHTDSTGIEQSHSGQVTRQAVNVDSIVNAVIQRTREEFSRQEQEHETVTETLTETIDSLGRVVRQSQKTTDRTLSRQEQQRIDRLEQTFEQQLHLAIMEHDSVWQDRFAEYQSTIRDSLQSVRDLQKQTSASNPITWWQQFRLHLANILIYSLALCAVVLVFRWWLKQKKVL